MMAEHTVKAFDEDITRLRGLITEMGGLAETALEGALDALEPLALQHPRADAEAVLQKELGLGLGGLGCRVG